MGGAAPMQIAALIETANMMIRFHLSQGTLII